MSNATIKNIQLEQHPRKNDVIKGYKVCGITKESRHGINFIWFKVENQKFGTRRLWAYNPENKKLSTFRTFEGIGGVTHYRTW